MSADDTGFFSEDPDATAVELTSQTDEDFQRECEKFGRLVKMKLSDLDLDKTFDEVIAFIMRGGTAERIDCYLSGYLLEFLTKVHCSQVVGTHTFVKKVVDTLCSLNILSRSRGVIQNNKASSEIVTSNANANDWAEENDKDSGIGSQSPPPSPFRKHDTKFIVDEHNAKITLEVDKFNFEIGVVTRRKLISSKFDKLMRGDLTDGEFDMLRFYKPETSVAQQLASSDADAAPLFRSLNIMTQERNMQLLNFLTMEDIREEEADFHGYLGAASREDVRTEGLIPVASPINSYPAENIDCDQEIWESENMEPADNLITSEKDQIKTIDKDKESRKRKRPPLEQLNTSSSSVITKKQLTTVFMNVIQPLETKRMCSESLNENEQMETLHINPRVDVGLDYDFSDGTEFPIPNQNDLEDLEVNGVEDFRIPSPLMINDVERKRKRHGSPQRVDMKRLVNVMDNVITDNLQDDNDLPFEDILFAANLPILELDVHETHAGPKVSVAMAFIAVLHAAANSSSTQQFYAVPTEDQSFTLTRTKPKDCDTPIQTHDF